MLVESERLEGIGEMGGVILSAAKDLGRWREILRCAQDDSGKQRVAARSKGWQREAMDDSLWQLTQFKNPAGESLLPSFQASFKGLFAIYD